MVNEETCVESMHFHCGKPLTLWDVVTFSLLTVTIE
jgi:hypothetical protein